MSERDTTDIIFTASSDLAAIDLANQPMEVQMQNYQSSTQLNEFKTFYKPKNDSNFYHVICKKIYYPPNSENLTSSDENDEDDYDYEFFHQDYHVTCKLISDELIEDILNKEIYGRNFDVNDLKRKHLLTLHQKFYLEQNLKQDILYYLCTPDNQDITFRDDLQVNQDVAYTNLHFATQ
jgi:hypothetical protein